MMSLEQAIAQYEQFANVCEHHRLTASQEEFEQLAAWLRELQDRRAEPEIIRCSECKHYKPMSSDWGNCYVHGSPTELHRTCHSRDYCSWAERRTDE